MIKITNANQIYLLGFQEYRNKKNWNSYDAEPLSNELLDFGIEMCSLLNSNTKVHLTSRESIRFKREENGIYYEMEISDDYISIYIKNEKTNKDLYSKKYKLVEEE